LNEAGVLTTIIEEESNYLLNDINNSIAITTMSRENNSFILGSMMFKKNSATS